MRDDNRIAFHAAEEAMEKGFRPCRRCRPAA
ncbi:MAG TPA: Ada metal-binding domain-containing protein [Thermoanaerobaculia bacterium]|nr:Ada metal-binding domain-containing protein [Thermoanaerobaculia bacterium]